MVRMNSDTLTVGLLAAVFLVSPACCAASVRTQSFDNDPKWECWRCRQTPKELPLVTQDFGYSRTSICGGPVGEIGGLLCRVEADADTHAYYADVIEPLTLDNNLKASGKLAFTLSAVDSGAYPGWFNTARQKRPPTKADQALPSEFVGLLIQGPSSVGHYVRPVSAGSLSTQVASAGPVIVADGKPHDWTVLYDPNANAGSGAVTVALDGAPAVLNLEPNLRREGAVLDRFGRMGQTGLAVWKKERLVALQADEDGEFWTQPVTLRGDTLLINCETRRAGHVRVEIEDVAGRSLEDCDPLIGDHPKSAVTWKGQSSIGVSPDKGVRLHFKLRSARLYSFEVR